MFGAEVRADRGARCIGKRMGKGGGVIDIGLGKAHFPRLAGVRPHRQPRFRHKALTKGGMRIWILSLALATVAAFAAPASAQLRPLVAPPESAAKASTDGVDVFLINEGAAPVPIAAPDTIDTIAQDGTALTLELIRSTADAAPVPAGGFAKLRYRLAPLGPAAGQVARAPDRPRAVSVGDGETQVADSAGVASAFVERFRPYEPTYVAIGSGQENTKAQVSFALRPFGGTGVLSHLNLAYTHTFFWAFNRPSGPITTSIYSPEVYFDVPVGEQVNVAFGYRHSSNGGGPTDSIDANRLYLRVNRQFDLGRGWRLDVAPQGWVFFGTRGIATDLDRFWGNGGITASITQRNGVKLALYGRGDPTTGRGAAELFLSYPLRRIGGDVGLYLFGQAFTGFGETLPRYNQRDTTARIGIALTR